MIIPHKIFSLQEILYLFHASSPQWLPTKAPPTPSDDHVTLGLLLDTDHAYSIVDMGPPADSPEAAEFGSFWGERSELRRFQDGSINEAVVWVEGGQGQRAGGGVAGKRMICLQIIQHLLHRCVVLCRISYLASSYFFFFQVVCTDDVLYTVLLDFWSKIDLEYIVLPVSCGNRILLMSGIVFMDSLASMS